MDTAKEDKDHLAYLFNFFCVCKVQGYCNTILNILFFQNQTLV